MSDQLHLPSNARPAAGEPAAVEPSQGRDGLLDVVKAAAIVRVIAWHTWSWWWLSWIPAMPAMFLASGALLADSLDRRGWWATVRQRVRRLLIPFWVYGAASWMVMILLGWQPTWPEVLPWLVPLTDPIGSPEAPGLWIPLWYLRAYLWFVLLSGVLAWLLRRVGAAAIAGAVVATLGMWAWEGAGHTVPFAVADGVAYSTFVLLGMRYRTHGAPSRRTAGWWGAAAAVAAVAWCVRFGPDDLVVNRSYVLLVLVGLAGAGAVLAARDRLSAVGGLPGQAVRLIGRRALTIYLWQGFGLLAAQRLVDARLEPGPARSILAITVVLAVIAAAVVVMGPLEDLAAGRRAVRVPEWPPLWRVGVSGVGAVAVVAAITVPLPAGAELEAPPSGRAVVARADMIAEAMNDGQGGEADPEEAAREQLNALLGTLPVEDLVPTWFDAHPNLVDETGFSTFVGAYATPAGDVVHLRWFDGALEFVPVHPDDDSAGGRQTDFDWWSMTKAATSAWLLRAVEAGLIDLGDPLARFVPEVPHAEDITLEHLARHRSGIPTDLDAGWGDESPVEALERYRNAPDLEFAPGEGFAYSRLGYFLIALALERATGTTWQDAMTAMASEAGVRLGFDDDVHPLDEVTDPDGHGYRGRLWSSGAIRTTPVEGVRFFQWLFTEGLTPESRALMTRFSTDPDAWFYGLGLVPVCPCREADGYLQADRVALDSLTGSFTVDLASGAVVMLHPDAWFKGWFPAREFYDLQSAVLESISR